MTADHDPPYELQGGQTVLYLSSKHNPDEHSDILRSYDYSLGRAGHPANSPRLEVFMERHRSGRPAQLPLPLPGQPARRANRRESG